MTLDYYFLIAFVWHILSFYSLRSTHAQYFSVSFQFTRSLEEECIGPKKNGWAKPKHTSDSRLYIEPRCRSAWVSHLPLSQVEPWQLDMNSSALKRLKPHNTFLLSALKKVLNVHRHGKSVKEGKDLCATFLLSIMYPYVLGIVPICVAKIITLAYSLQGL